MKVVNLSGLRVRSLLVPRGRTMPLPPTDEPHYSTTGPILYLAKIISVSYSGFETQSVKPFGRRLGELPQ